MKFIVSTIFRLCFCSNEIIFSLFSHKKNHNDYLIPLVKRYSAKVIREFRRLGFKQQESRSTIYDTSSNDQIIKSYKCFGINIP